MIVTNHTYDVIGNYVPIKEMGGVENSQMRVYDRLSLKEKRKGWNNYCRQPYQAETAKSRLSKENKDVTVCLYYDERGLDRYYGLLETGRLVDFGKTLHWSI